MNLHNLSTGGWFLFAWCIVCLMMFAFRLVQKNTNFLVYHVILTAALCTWFVRLVTGNP